MGTSQARSIYFEKHIRAQPTAASYIKALSESPYRTHRRMSIALSPMLESLVTEQNNQIREKELDDFAKILEAP